MYTITSTPQSGAGFPYEYDLIETKNVTLGSSNQIEISVVKLKGNETYKADSVNNVMISGGKKLGNNQFLFSSLTSDSKREERLELMTRILTTFNFTDIVTPNFNQRICFYIYTSSPGKCCKLAIFPSIM